MFLPLIIGILNALRGSGFWKDDTRTDWRQTAINIVLARPFWILCMTIVIIFFAAPYNHPIIDKTFFGITLFSTLEFAFVFGWGLYLNIAYPNITYINEPEIKIIDWITTTLYKKPVNAQEFSNWCFIAFAFRSLLFYPIFIVLSFYNTPSLYWGCGVFLLPVVYWLRRFVPEIYSVRIAEFIFGSILGYLIEKSLL